MKKRIGLVARAVSVATVAFFSVSSLTPAVFAKGMADARAQSAQDDELALPSPEDFASLDGDASDTPAPLDSLALPSRDAAAAEPDVMLGAPSERDGVWVHHAPDPVNAKNANEFLPAVDLVIPGPGFDLRVARAYNSRSTESGSFGYGWSFNYDVKVAPDAHGDYRLTDPDGFVCTFSKAGIDSEKVRAKIARDVVAAIRASDEARHATVDESHYATLLEKLESDRAYLETEAARVGTGTKAGEGIFWSTDRGVQKLVVGAQGFQRVMPDGSLQSFDRAGRLVRVTDRNGNFLTLSFTREGRLQSVADRAGR
ncbi:MAG TPA: RHS repeat domain-containing protein, partial [bacterium]|nr:RHS repeat domain-containing protein [bacterium]